MAKRYELTSTQWKLRLRGDLPTWHVWPVAQQDDLGLQPGSRLERRDRDVAEQAQECDH